MLLQRKSPLDVEENKMDKYKEPPYQPNKSLLSDPTIKDHHLAKAVRESDFSPAIEKIFQSAAVIAAKESA